MKDFKLILISAFLFVFPVVVSAQGGIYDKYNDKQHVSSVYISKTMLEMQPEVYTKDVNIGKVAGQLEAVYIVSTMDNNIKKSLRSDLAEFIKKGKYEVLMKQKGIVSSSSFYVRKKGDKVKELIMISDGAAKFNYIHLVGEMTLKDIQRITSSQAMSMNFNYPLQEVILTKLQNMDLSWLEDHVRELQSTVLEQLEDIHISGVSFKF